MISQSNGKSNIIGNRLQNNSLRISDYLINDLLINLFII